MPTNPVGNSALLSAEVREHRAAELAAYLAGHAVCPMCSDKVMAAGRLLTAVPPGRADLAAAAIEEAAVALAGAGGEGSDAAYGPSLDFYSGQGMAVQPVMRTVPERRRTTSWRPGYGMQPVQGATAPEPPHSAPSRVPGVRRRRAKQDQRARKLAAKSRRHGRRHLP